MVDCQELARLNEFRWENPENAAIILERAIGVTSIELLAETLLIYGSTSLQLGQFNDARWAFVAAETIAQESGDRLSVGMALHKRAKVEDADGNLLAALTLLRQAGGTFTEIGDLGRATRVLVSTAIHYSNRGIGYAAIGCAQAALDQLPEDDHWNRFSSFQQLALSFSEAGDLDAAQENLEFAKLILPHCPKAAEVRFVWLEARVKKTILPAREISRLLREAAAFFLGNGEIVDGALATLEYAKWLLLLGETDAVQVLAKGAKSLAFTAEECGARGRVAATALMVVYRAGLKGAVTESVLASAICRVCEAAGAPAALYYS
jgi:tetratricopeptide (TPR) repeat protein